jgi:hypothetical protein
MYRSGRKIAGSKRRAASAPPSPAKRTYMAATTRPVHRLGRHRNAAVSCSTAGGMVARARKKSHVRRHGPYWSGPVISMSPIAVQTASAARASGIAGRYTTSAAPTPTIQVPMISIGANTVAKSLHAKRRTGIATRKTSAPRRNVYVTGTPSPAACAAACTSAALPSGLPSTAVTTAHSTGRSPTGRQPGRPMDTTTRLSRKKNPANGRPIHATASCTAIASTTATGTSPIASHHGMRRAERT